MGSPEGDDSVENMERLGREVKKLGAVLKAVWANRKAEIAIVGAIVALVKPYVH